jgi:hypothetical protein
MCFSAEASFAASAALLPAGAFCVHRAVHRDARLLPLALTPAAFGVQQAAEGFVWLGLHRGDAALVERGAVVFLFFALAFWPFWIPFSLLPVEGRRAGKRILAVAVALSLVWIWVYFPLAAEPGRLLSTAVVHHSIAYDFRDLPALHLAPRVAWRIAYLAAICVPLLVARPGVGYRLRLIVGVLIAALFAFCYLVYWYAFTSVWCFFAALLALLLVGVFARLPERPGRPTAAGPFAGEDIFSASPDGKPSLVSDGVGDVQPRGQVGGPQADQRGQQRR